MNLTQAIHARWAADETLNRHLPSGQVLTGLALAGVPGPWASIAVRRGVTEGYTNDGSSVERITVRIQVHHEDYDQGWAAADAVLAAFDRADFPLSDGDRVMSMQKNGMPREVQDPRSGRWEWLLDFTCRVFRTPRS
jgi:hypothetical protein